MSTPGEVIDAIPPTDARTEHRGRIVRQDIERLNAKAVERRDEAMKRERLIPALARRFPSQNVLHRPRQFRIFVKPANPQRVVLDLAGVPYPSAGLYVPVSDVYVQRRLRDGSLVRATPSEGD